MAFRPQREFELFGMSLLDLLCCGLGGMILLFLVLVSQARVNSQSRGRVEGRQWDQEALARRLAALLHFFTRSNSGRRNVGLSHKEQRAFGNLVANLDLDVLHDTVDGDERLPRPAVRMVWRFPEAEHEEANG